MSTEGLEELSPCLREKLPPYLRGPARRRKRRLEIHEQKVGKHRTHRCCRPTARQVGTCTTTRSRGAARTRTASVS